jgi:hypothetical protein
VPITTKVVSSNPTHGEVYSIQNYVMNLSVTCKYLWKFKWFWFIYVIQLSMLLLRRGMVQLFMTFSSRFPSDLFRNRSVSGMALNIITLTLYCLFCRKFWLLDETFFTKKSPSLSNLRDQCYISAIEKLQQIRFVMLSLFKEYFKFLNRLYDITNVE